MRKASPMVLAVREIVRDKGVNADTDVIKQALKGLYPDLYKQIDAKFTPILSKQRAVVRAESEADGAAPVSKGRRKGKSRPTTSALYAMADDLWTMVGGDTKHAEKLLDHLKTVDIEMLQRAFQGFRDLVATTGGIDAARKTIASMKKSGLIE